MTEKFITKPNLPSARVTKVIISDRYNNITAELHKLGIKTVEAKPLDSVYGSEKYHADVSCIHLGGNKIITAKNNTDLLDKLQNDRFDIIPSQRSIYGGYKTCVALNAVLLNDFVICNTNLADKELLKQCELLGYKTVHINQGYAKCSTAIVSENAVITSDDGIYKAAVANDIDALKISSGYIKLEGYDYGFIGGACGKIGADALAFCGDIKSHPNYESIRSFCINHGVYICSIGQSELTDIGGILPVTQCE